MPYYSVSHPQLDITATVNAPSSEKARTTFLDYLERTGKVKRSQRQLIRRAMATKRIEEGGEGYSDLELNYEYEHVPEAETLQLGEPQREELPMSSAGGMGEVPIRQEAAPITSGMMPIQELALTGKVGG